MKSTNELGWKHFGALAAALLLTADGWAQRGLSDEGSGQAGDLGNDLRTFTARRASAPKNVAGPVLVNLPGGNLGNDLRGPSTIHDGGIRQADAGVQGNLGNDLRGPSTIHDGGIRQADAGVQGSLEHDLRGPGTIYDGGLMQADAREAQPGLVLGWEVSAYAGTDPNAVIPTREDLKNTLRLAGGTPGMVGLISVELPAAGGSSQGPRSARYAGVFDSAGTIEVELPGSLDPGGLRARGAELAGGSIVSAVEVDLEESARTAFASWQILAGVDAPRGVYPGFEFRHARRHAQPHPTR